MLPYRALAAWDIKGYERADSLLLPPLRLQAK